MDSGTLAILMPILAMIVYALFAWIRRATRDPARERENLAETERRITEIERENHIDRAP